MSGRPAGRLGLKTRGRIAPGYDADLVVYDPVTVDERGTYQDPHHYPVGIPHVLVNGALAVRDGQHTGALAGQVLRAVNIFSGLALLGFGLAALAGPLPRL